MRLYQQIRASIARPAVSGAIALVFACGMPLSASGQVAAPQTPQTGAAPAGAPTVQGTPLGIEDAVRMALENNLGVQAEKLNPQIQVLGIARADAAFAPTLFYNLSRRSATAPPTELPTRSTESRPRASTKSATKGARSRPGA